MVFLAFIQKTLKRYYLPEIENFDHRICLNKEIFGLPNDIFINFEVINHKWYVCADNKNYNIKQGNIITEQILLDDDKLFSVEISGKVTINIIYINQKFTLSSYKKISLNNIEKITFGTSRDNDIQFSLLNVISRHHFYIIKHNNKFLLVDTSTNGVFVNNKRVNKSQYLNYSDVIDAFGLRMLFMGDVLAVDDSSEKIVFNFRYNEIKKEMLLESRTPLKHIDKYFNRSPRVFPLICSDEVVIEAPTTLQMQNKKSLLLTIGPSLTMAIPMLLGCILMIFSMNEGSGTFLLLGIVTALGSALIGALWAFLSYRDEKRKEAEEENTRFNLYSNYLIETSEYIKGKYSQNYYALHSMYPSANQCCNYGKGSSELWSRNYTHEDFLFTRLGIGNIDFQMKIKIPTEKFSIVYDSLQDKPAMLYNNFKTLSNVPVGVDFKANRLVGIAGGKNKVGCYQIINNIVAQLASSISYTDVKFVFCLDGNNDKEIRELEYVKWLPHVWDETKQTRYFATNPDEIQDVLFELLNIIRGRAEQGIETTNKNKEYLPHYFLIVSNISMLDDELIYKYILDKDNNYGLTTLVLTDKYQNLPNTCENIIQNDDEFTGFFNVLNSKSKATNIAFDNTSSKKLLAFAKKISNITVKEIEDNASIVNSLSFLEMYGVHTIDELNIYELWQKNKTYNSIKALVGKKVGNSNCYLDIHEKLHGPHGLIAGTTGSGKSELIQTYMLSLAINFSPEDIAFFVIDFKGGGMANLFSDLPHMVGQISNLSGNQIDRAMISIKSENIRRQKLFSEFGVNNINLYTQLYKSGKSTIPIPHLIIIIDEFAELKKEEPEFMKELISVAQVGRSLGVHLILATQKPSGTVDDNIWSNSKFRMCLRVQDRQDSSDMLHKPDAAYITQAGRCYLQVGNDEIFELFQSGYSGAPYEKYDETGDNEIATIITNTGKTALVGNYTKIKRKEHEKNGWYGFLYESIKDLKENPLFDDDLQLIDNISDEKIAEKVISLANDNGYNISNNYSNIRSIVSFIKLMPYTHMKTDEAVEYIKHKAYESNVKLPEIAQKTQLEAIVEYIAKLARNINFVQKSQLWMPLLKEEILLNSIIDSSNIYREGIWPRLANNSLNAVVGIYDDPQNQSQLPYSIDFVEGGNIAVCGSVVTGKSTFMQTLLYSLAIKYSPEVVNFYILDFSSGMLSCFEEMPHTGGVIKENEIEKVDKFFNMLKSIITERKELLNGSNFIQYNKICEDKIPSIIIVIDNFAGFKEKTDNIYEDILIQLSREGLSYGIYLVLSSAGFGMSEIQNRIGDNIKTVVSLEMSDKFKYMDVLRTTRIDVMPEKGIRGRGISIIDGRVLEFQTALSIEANDDYKRNSVIESIAKDMNSKWLGKRARAIPYIPENPEFDDIASLDEYINANNSRRWLPYAYNYEDASVYSIDLIRTYCYVISGKKRTGKTNVLKLLISASLNKDVTDIIIEMSGNKLRNIALRNNIIYLEQSVDIYNYFNSLTNEFVVRNKAKKRFVESGLSDEEIYKEMQEYKDIYIFISDLGEFIDFIYNPDSNLGNMSGFFENIFEKGHLHNIYFFASLDSGDTDNIISLDAYQLFTSYKTGVHLGGNISSQRIFDFQNIHYSQLSKTMKKGEGLVPDYDDETQSRKIIIPHYGENSI